VKTPDDFRPGYVALLDSGELDRRVATAWNHLEDCDLCARYCHVNRRETTKGAVCRTGERAVVNGFGPHHGEEDPLRGWNGSGTIFFSWCNLRCVFCQNWEISQQGLGQEVDAEELAEMMLALQAAGCNNVNLVTPSHVVAQILEALVIAAERGLPALAIWLWFVVVLARDLAGEFRRTRLPFLAAGGVAALTAMLAAGMFEYNFGDSEFLMIFLVLVTLPFAARRAAPADA
jgi:hypothetical protein